MNISQIPTPAQLVERSVMKRNLNYMQKLADTWHVSLRPHTKTHKTPEIAQLQIGEGARGITVAKTGEAEVMASAGISDIFIANEIVGVDRLNRIFQLCKQGNHISFGVDSLFAIQQIAHVFTIDCPAHILIEVETGEGRSGVCTDEVFDTLLDAIGTHPNIVFEGVFSHEGHSYHAQTIAEANAIFEQTQNQTLHYAHRAKIAGFTCHRVSIGSTPSILSARIEHTPILEGITEIRPGTYVFMDAGQAAILGSFEQCAATVLATVTSQPTSNRTIADAGAKALTMQSRDTGICFSPGKGVIIEPYFTHVTGLYDEHTVIEDSQFTQQVSIGDMIRIIPNHICPVVNLYNELYLVDGTQVIDTYRIAARGEIT
jgi:D-serine deaminase-like pyridoxal phosphate-dependent protein